MERTLYTVSSPDLRPYPLYSQNPNLNSPPTYQPTYNNVFPPPTYGRNNPQISYQIPPTMPAQNYYRVQPEMQMRPQSPAFPTQFVNPQPGPYYSNPQQNVPISYQPGPYLSPARQPNQTAPPNKPPTTQYIPIEVQQQRPVRVTPPSMIYNLNSQIMDTAIRYQPVVVEQPQLYERREIGYRAVPDRVAAAKQVASQIRYEDPYQNQNPMVRTVEKSFSAGSVRSSRHVPPPVQQRKTACPTWILGVLGVVGVVGLILALVLGQNSKGIAVVQTTSPTVAQPQKVNTPAVATTPSQPTSISPSKDVTNAVVNGQTAVTTPTIVTPANNDLPKVVVPTAVSVKPTDTSLTNPPSTTPNNNFAMQPQTIAPNTGTPPTTTLPTTVQPILLPTPQPSPTPNYANPPTVQPTAVPSTIAPNPNTGSAINRPQTVTPIPVASTTATAKPAHFLANRHNS